MLPSALKISKRPHGIEESMPEHSHFTVHKRIEDLFDFG